jgi:hypothetical protein
MLKPSIAHNDADCNRMVCQACKTVSSGQHGFHLTQDCPERICVAEECLTTITNGCKEHCLGCGFPNLQVEGFAGRHVCQWEGHRDAFAQGQRMVNNELVMTTMVWVALVCKKNKEHKMFAPDLAEVRERGWRRLLVDVQNWDKTPENDPFSKLPIVECEQCFDERYEHGNYKMQQTGVVPKQSDAKTEGQLKKK